MYRNGCFIANLVKAKPGIKLGGHPYLSTPIDYNHDYSNLLGNTNSQLLFFDTRGDFAPRHHWWKLDSSFGFGRLGDLPRTQVLGTLCFGGVSKQKSVDPSQTDLIEIRQWKSNILWLISIYSQWYSITLISSPFGGAYFEAISPLHRMILVIDELPEDPYPQQFSPRSTDNFSTENDLYLGLVQVSRVKSQDLWV